MRIADAPKETERPCGAGKIEPAATPAAAATAAPQAGTARDGVDGEDGARARDAAYLSMCTLNRGATELTYWYKRKNPTKVGVAKTNKQKKRDTVDLLFGKTPSRTEGSLKKVELLALEKQLLNDLWGRITKRMNTPSDTQKVGEAMRKHLQDLQERALNGNSSKLQAAEKFWEKPLPSEP